MTDAITHGFGCTALFIIISAISFLTLIGFDSLYQEIKKWWKHRRGN
jgi:hypothetical protein